MYWISEEEEEVEEVEEEEKSLDRGKIGADL